jgi:nucleoid-associated protein YgaU
MKKTLALLLAVMLVVSLCAVGAAAADGGAVAITPAATYNGAPLTMTATGVGETYTLFDLASIGYGTAVEYAFWFDADGTFSFDQDVALSFQGQPKAELKAGEIYAITGYSECYVTLDDGNMIALIESAAPGNFASLTPDKPFADFPGTISSGTPLAPAEEAPAEEAPAEEAPAEEPAAAAAADAVVYVTISVAGEIVAPSVPVLASDLNADGIFDVDEVLKCAHDQLYPGGAAAGYASSLADWGLGMDMLWGDTSYAFGYYVNNAMAWGLSDPVPAGGSVYAYVYTDKEYYSDIFSYFDKADAVAENGALTLTLYAGSFDENWNVVFAPFAGAAITCDGTATEFVTDENGQVTVTFDAAGSYLLSAVAADGATILVPAICKVTAEAAEEAAPAEPAPAESAPATIPDITPAHAEGTTAYTVKEGDTIRSIAKDFYGTIFKWRLIYEANYDSMVGTDMIYVGQVLQIP